MPASSMPSRCSFIHGTSKDREEFVTNKLREYNQSFTGKLQPITTQPTALLEIYPLQVVDSVVGGLIGRTNEITDRLEVSIVAPDFYRKTGCKQYGELENCPRGETVHFL